MAQGDAVVQTGTLPRSQVGGVVGTRSERRNKVNDLIQWPVRQFVVSFPSALIGAGMTRAYDYEVAAEVDECDVRRVAATKRVYSPGYFNMPERESKTVKCVFALSELGTRRASYLVPSVRFRVRAAESFGKTSDAIFSGFVEF